MLARRAAKRLRELMPHARVRLTRRRDRYLTLAQRRDLANRWGATVFVSVHLNASRSRSQSGFETYVLSTEASDKEAARLAHAENQRKTPRGLREHVAQPPRGAPKSDGDVAAILGDLQQRATHMRSLMLAKSMQRALRKARPKAKDRGVRQAPFDVLLGLHMPGVLVEVGFIDHVIEGKQMLNTAVQARVANALADGVRRFLRPDKKTVAAR